MYVMITATYPFSALQQLGEARTRAEASSPAQSVTKVHHELLRPDREKGGITYTIIEVDEGKEYEGLWQIGRAMLEYASVESYTYSLDVVYSREEIAANMPA